MSAASRQTSCWLHVVNPSQLTSGKQQQLSLCMGEGDNQEKEEKKARKVQVLDQLNSS